LREREEKKNTLPPQFVILEKTQFILQNMGKNLGKNEASNLAPDERRRINCLK